MGHTSWLEYRFVLRLTHSFAPARFKPIVEIGRSCIVVAWITGCILCIGSKTIGHGVESMVPPELPAHRVFKQLISFTYLPSKLCCYELDVPEQLRVTIELYDQVISLGRVLPRPTPNLVTILVGC